MPNVPDGESKRYCKGDLRKYVPERSVGRTAYGKTGCIWLQKLKRKLRTGNYNVTLCSVLRFFNIRQQVYVN
jgi:hypothetical protein